MRKAAVRRTQTPELIVSNTENHTTIRADLELIERLLAAYERIGDALLACAEVGEANGILDLKEPRGLVRTGGLNTFH